MSQERATIDKAIEKAGSIQSLRLVRPADIPFHSELLSFSIFVFNITKNLY